MDITDPALVDFCLRQKSTFSDGVAKCTEYFVFLMFVEVVHVIIVNDADCVEIDFESRPCESLLLVCCFNHCSLHG